jgi:hypothetical protein
MKIIGLDEIYKILVLRFQFKILKMVKKNNIKFQQHINRVLELVVLEKSYLSCMVSNKDT